jgi:hypothetical protein
LVYLGMIAERKNSKKERWGEGIMGTGKYNRSQ